MAEPKVFKPGDLDAAVVPVAALFAYDKISAVVFADGDLKKAPW